MTGGEIKTEHEGFAEVRQLAMELHLPVATEPATLVAVDRNLLLLILRHVEKARQDGESPVDKLLWYPVPADVAKPDIAVGIGHLTDNVLLANRILSDQGADIDHRDFVAGDLSSLFDISLGGEGFFDGKGHRASPQ